jgi:uncharacterized protein (UPF0261 family)
LADHMAGIAGEAKGPVRFYLPLGGFSSHDSAEGNIHEPTLPPLFAAYVQKVMPKNVDVQIVDAHINDDAFADALTAAVLALTKS